MSQHFTKTSEVFNNIDRNDIVIQTWLTSSWRWDSRSICSLTMDGLYSTI